MTHIPEIAGNVYKTSDRTTLPYIQTFTSVRQKKTYVWNLRNLIECVCVIKLWTELERKCNVGRSIKAEYLYE